MPELPEVESTRRHLLETLTGARLEAVWIGHPRTGRRNQRPSDVVERLTGRRVERLGRRGKFLMADVEDDLTWVIHLGMSGRIALHGPADPVTAHTHFRATTDAGIEMRFIDPRTFGFVAVFTPEELSDDPLSRLGRDALEDLPTTAEFSTWLDSRTAPIKALLLDQRFVAGLGNIYADEILHLAGVHPRRPGGSLRLDEIERLRSAVPLVLEAGVAMGGTSLDDLAYLLPDGRAGDYLDRLMVYGNEGEPCEKCGNVIERMVVAQRSSHFCSRCQV